MAFNSLRSLIGGCIFSFAAAASASAGTIPYPGMGENPVNYTFTAASTGDIVAYFYGSGASYNETLGLLVNGVPVVTDPLGGVLQDHTSTAGDKYNFGPVTAGATLTFYINVQETNSTYYSDASLNTSDGNSNHIYSTDFAGSDLIPAGTYVGFEDLASKNADFNYADEQFVFTNTATSVAAVPLPTSAPMFGAALIALGAVGYRMKRKQTAAA